MAALTAETLPWQLLPAGRRRALPPALREVLYDRGSLTARVRARCPARFRVVLLGQWADRLDPTGAGVLQLAPRARVLRREVLLCCGSVPLVFAHSVLPAASLTGPWRRLGRLGVRPLGATLFDDRRVRRSAIRVVRLPPHGLAARHIAAAVTTIGKFGPAAPLHGRYSIFQLAARRVFVSEFFLPQWQDRQPAMEDGA